MIGSYLFRYLLKDFYYLITSPEGRSFLKLCAVIGHRNRYEPLSVKVNGFEWSLPDAMSFLWQYHEIFFLESYKFKSQMKQPIIVDCGSNVGLSIYYFKRLYPYSRVFGFEADEGVFQYLQSNVGSLPNVEISQKAVWVHDQGVSFHTEGADGGLINATEQGNVPSIRLREVLRDFDHIDMLKMDIEGAEFEVLDDCWEEMSKVDHLFLELHTFRKEPQAIGKVLLSLEKSGFRYFVSNENEIKSPFVTPAKTMDLQLNVFAYRPKAGSLQ